MIARSTFINTRFTTTFGDVFVSKQTRPDIGEPAPEVTTFFVTDSQGTITPVLFFSDASLADWDFGDGTLVPGNNAPSHTYTDGQPSHNVEISGFDPATLRNINLAGDGITSANLSPYTGTQFLTINNNPGLTSLDISALVGLQDLASFNTNAGASLNFTGLNSVVIFRSWNSGLTDSALATLTSPTLDTLVVRTNPLTTIDPSPFPVLRGFQCWGCALVGPIDTSNNPALENFSPRNNPGLGALDISSNPLLISFDIRDTGRAAGEIDQYLIDLDGHGQTNGSLDYSSNPGAPTLAALTAYNNLISKGWTITGPVPA